MSWAGISNENEFYSEHYLAEVFSGDIKELLDAWLEQEKNAKAEATTGNIAITDRTPWSRLGTLARDWQQTEREFRRARSSADKLSVQRLWLQSLCTSLQLPWSPVTHTLSDRCSLPLLASLNTADHKPLLWVLEALPLQSIDDDPLTLSVQPEQINDDEASDIPLPKEMQKQNWQTLLTSEVYTSDDAPRWIILASPHQWLLLDRAKFAQNRLLRFDWSELLTRRDTDTLKATAILLHSDSILSKTGTGTGSLHDNLDESAHKHAYGVSEDLKYALRESIELLGNEAAKQLRERARDQKTGIFSGADALNEEQLTAECLRYMYRLLFVFYIEARPELGYAPVDNPTYLTSYSLEHLRSLELVQLNTEADRNGHYLHHTINTLFKLIDEGFEDKEQTELRITETEISYTTADAFTIAPLKSHLFQPERIKLLNYVMFPNHILQRIIELMSLSRPGSKSRKRRGRISYAQLGINQLGAVYEALLSFRGFFAKEDLYEVRKAGEKENQLDTGYFVNADALEKYTDDEKVYDKDEAGHKKLRLFKKGSFIYRMAGRDRQKSASYYTPEVLTRCLVKYALKELFKQQLDPLPNDKARAEHLLTMTVCEPAMGSAAFLNEAVNQLADKYLQLAQSASGTLIPQSQYAQEKQRVKMYLADHNVFGVDLNPVAVELAEVSLWLNALSRDRFVPWFGLQLHCGNSLIGARRETFRITSLATVSAKDSTSWLNRAPDKLPMTEALPEKQVWHFLLPDKGMANYADKTAKQLFPGQISAINQWRKDFCAKFSSTDIQRLQKLSQIIDSLWQEHAKSLHELRKKTTDPYSVFGYTDTSHSKTPLHFKDAALDGELLAKDLANTSAYIRLKMVMDYWCALWFWPIDQYEALPSRDEYLFDLENLLLADTVQSQPLNTSGDLFSETTSVREGERFVNEYGVVNKKVLYKASPRFKTVDDMAKHQRFFHWNLVFADIFKERGGFDLVLGNPPWIKVEWEEAGVLGDTEPLFAIRDYRASDLDQIRPHLFKNDPTLQKKWTDEYTDTKSQQEYLKKYVNNDLLEGTSKNLYKCFVAKSLVLVRELGTIGLIHESGIYSEDNAKILRSACYERLRFHFSFSRAMDLFGIKGNAKTVFECVVMGRATVKIKFDSISFLSHPSEIDNIYSNLSVTYLTDDHTKSRLIQVNPTILKLFRDYFTDSHGDVANAAMASIKNSSILEIMETIKNYNYRVSTVCPNHFSNEFWHETANTKDLTITKQSGFATQTSEIIYSGPNFYVGNPYYKSAKRIFDSKKAYDSIHIEFIGEEDVPRTLYKPNVTKDEYRSRIPIYTNTIGDECRLDTNYRLINREMIDNLSERTLITAIIPPKTSHVHTILGNVFESDDILLDSFSFSLSIVVDFYVRSRSLSHANNGVIRELPTLNPSNSDLTLIRNHLHVRALGLTCLTRPFASLWVENYQKSFSDLTWSISTKNNPWFSELTREWHSQCGIRNQFLRRQALLEIDVLVSQAMGLTWDHLITLYHEEFDLFRRNDTATFYDTTGKIVFTENRGIPGVGLPRKARKSDLKNNISYSINTPERTEENIALGWEDIRDYKTGTVSKTFMDDTLPDGPHQRTIEYTAPFFCPDREEDYRVAWEFFESKTEDTSS